jgi:hypothetical protein
MRFTVRRRAKWEKVANSRISVIIDVPARTATGSEASVFAAIPKLALNGWKTKYGSALEKS